MDLVAAYSQKIQSLLVIYVPRIIMAVVVLTVGWWLIGWACRFVTRATSHLDGSLGSFLTSLVSIVLKVLLLISAAGMAGFQTTSFVAILGAAGLAVGLALQGTLANFAGGVLILIFKPYVVGDTIEAQGKSGEVRQIQIFNTILVTPQGDTVILPNGTTSNGVIVNKTSQNKALVEITVDVDTATDLAALRGWAIPLLQADEEVADVPAPQVVVTGIKPGGMTLAFRAYTAAGRSTEAHARLIEKIQQRLAQEAAA